MKVAGVKPGSRVAKWGVQAGSDIVEVSRVFKEFTRSEAKVRRWAHVRLSACSRFLETHPGRVNTTCLLHATFNIVVKSF